MSPQYFPAVESHLDFDVGCSGAPLCHGPLGLGKLLPLHCHQPAHDVTGAAEPTAGEALIVFSAAIQGTTGTLVRKNPTVPPVVQSCIGAGVAAATTLPAALLFEHEPFSHATWQGWLAVLYLAIAGSVIAFTLVLSLIHRIGANRVASTVYVTPLIALTLGSLLEHEPLGARLAVGSALVLGGVWLANRVR